MQRAGTEKEKSLILFEGGNGSDVRMCVSSTITSCPSSGDDGGVGSKSTPPSVVVNLMAPSVVGNSTVPSAIGSSVVMLVSREWVSLSA